MESFCDDYGIPETGSHTNQKVPTVEVFIDGAGNVLMLRRPSRRS